MYCQFVAQVPLVSVANDLRESRAAVVAQLVERRLHALVGRGEAGSNPVRTEASFCHLGLAKMLTLRIRKVTLLNLKLPGTC